MNHLHFVDSAQFENELAIAWIKISELVTFESLLSFNWRFDSMFHGITNFGGEKISIYFLWQVAYIGLKSHTLTEYIARVGLNSVKPKPNSRVNM